MTTSNRGLETVPSNSLQPSVPINADLAVLDAAIYGTTSIEFTSDANLTLTQAQCDASALVFTDSPVTLTTGRDVIFPAHFPQIHVKNSTAQTLTLKKSGQTGVTLAAGIDCMIASGVTDVVKASLGGSVLAPSVQSVTSSATVTPTFSDDLVKITAQATGLTLANPTGTAKEGYGIVIRIKDNGTARSIAYGTQYRALGVTLPTTTVISKTLYLGMIFNSDDTKWDVTAVAQEV